MATRSFSPSCSTSRLQSPLDQRELVGLDPSSRRRRPGRRGCWRPPGLVDRLGGDADPGQPVLGVPGAAGDLDVNGEGIVARIRRRRVVIGEVVEHLLDADGVLGREHVLVEEAPDVGVARRIDVDREGRLGVVADRPETGCRRSGRRLRRRPGLCSCSCSRRPDASAVEPTWSACACALSFLGLCRELRHCTTRRRDDISRPPGDSDMWLIRRRCGSMLSVCLTSPSRSRSGSLLLAASAPLAAGAGRSEAEV